MSAARDMLTILALDPGARLAVSQYTGAWYVESRIEIGNGTFLRGVAEHADEPEAAVAAFLAKLRDTGTDEYVAVTRDGQRREYRWNGAAFADCTRPNLAERDRS